MRVAGLIDTALVRAIEILAAALVALETLILFAGVVSRYVVHNPLTWSDELASILFLWLAMLGAVVAYARAEHMRMGALVARFSAQGRAFFDALALAVGIAFLALIFYPGFDYAMDEIAITTPALQIPNIWRAAALPVGIALMLVLAALRFTRRHRRRDLALAIVVIAAIAAALIFAKPLLSAIGNYKLVVFFVVLVGTCVLAAVPIAFAFGIGTFAYLALTTHVPWSVVVSRMDEGMSHIILLSVPLFVFLGLLIEITGMARAMVDFLARLLGHVRGGLSYVLLGAMYLVSGISGSKAADMAAVAPVLFPAMKARGESGGRLVALLASTGAMTETIPPSLVLITIGSVTGVSIAALFTGGLLPALVLTLALAALVWWTAGRTEASPAARAAPRAIARAFIIALPGLALPFLIRAAVVEGVATATEVSTIGVVYPYLRHRRRAFVSAARMGAALACARRDRGAVGRNPVHHWRRDRDGLGADAVGLFTRSRGEHGAAAGRRGRIYGGVDCGFRDPRQRARRHPGDRLVRPASVSDRTPARHP